MGSSESLTPNGNRDSFWSSSSEVDSTYGSQESLPRTKTTPPSHYDGEYHKSTDFDPFWSTTFEPAKPKTHYSLTLPKSSGTNPFANPRNYRKRPPLPQYNTESSINSTGYSRAPDRFIPPRRSPDAIIQNFRANKDPFKLSPSERLARRNSASPDAFYPRRIVTSPIPSVNRPHIHHTSSISRGGGPSNITFRRDSTSTNGERNVSAGAVWTVGGLAPTSAGVSNGRGGLVGSGTNAPLYTTSFATSRPTEDEESEFHECRIATALDLDRTQRVLEFSGTFPQVPRNSITGKRRNEEIMSRTTWKDSAWRSSDMQQILDAPNLRDDFYCSVLAYCPTGNTLAVALGPMLYAWSEKDGVCTLNAGTDGSWLTSVGFSSTQGMKCILGFGRSNGLLSLLSLYDVQRVRFEIKMPAPIACIQWRPTMIMRPSRSPLGVGSLVVTEDLVVGDEAGNLWYYVVEWPDVWDVECHGWLGCVTLVARISIHTQQVCGLAWSRDGLYLASGGNDNLCLLFEISKILKTNPNEPLQEQEISAPLGQLAAVVMSDVNRELIRAIYSGAEKHRWVHGAAVKAISFCPWRDHLIATGGGSNDKCIHFFHTLSGACTATISVAAQVTSLIWSTTRREIAATFGYAQPDHPYRIAIFSWPQCKVVAAIPWEGEHRALYAIPYPGGPMEGNGKEGGKGSARTRREGCIVVAASDESVKFHEVWAKECKGTKGADGLLGGSDILEGLEGIDKEGEIIR